MINSLDIHSSPLLNAASELIGILVTLPRQGTSRNVSRFRQILLDGLTSFRTRGKHLDYHPNVIEKSCFVLCAALDEAILHTAWGEQARWENHSLLSSLFSQRNGGEAFFVVLENATQQPSKLLDFIELQYVLLQLGFKGKFRHEGDVPLHEISADAYTLIRKYRGDSSLPVPLKPEIIQRKQPRRILNIYRVLSLACCVALTGFILSEYWYANQVKPMIEATHALKSFDVNFVTPTKMTSDEHKSTSTSKHTRTQNPISPTLLSHLHIQKWQVIFGVFTSSGNIVHLTDSLKREGYTPLVRHVERGSEIYIAIESNVTDVKKLKGKFDEQFGLNVLVRKW
nr:type IVB secretion system protein IcmH/DotU [Vibrio sinus]